MGDVCAHFVYEKVFVSSFFSSLSYLCQTLSRQKHSVFVCVHERLEKTHAKRRSHHTQATNLLYCILDFSSLFRASDLKEIELENFIQKFNMTPEIDNTVPRNTKDNFKGLL